MKAAVLIPLIAVMTMTLPLMACREDMQQQPHLKPYQETDLWQNGTEAQPIPENTVARGALAYDAAVLAPPPITEARLAQGRRDYDEFCSPCHGLSGEGDGMIVRRGFSPPPSYHTARLRTAPPEHFVDVITRGYGAMYGYADRVPPADRWGIVAYIRALQLSRRTALADVPDAREHLK